MSGTKYINHTWQTDMAASLRTMLRMSPVVSRGSDSIRQGHREEKTLPPAGNKIKRYAGKRSQKKYLGRVILFCNHRSKDTLFLRNPHLMIRSDESRHRAGVRRWLYQSHLALKPGTTINFLRTIARSTCAATNSGFN